MKVKWLGVSCFVITSAEGTKIITDPYKSGLLIRYRRIEETAHVVTVSHEHFDHNNVAAIGGNPQVLRGAGSFEVAGITVRGIASRHYSSSIGRWRGPNTIFCLTVDGIGVCHLGDLGHQLSEEQASQIGEVDILMLPVGGRATIDARGASLVCDQLKPRVAIPMHYKTAKLLLPFAGVDPFLEGKPDIRRLDASEVEFKKDELPSPTQIVVLKPAG